MHRITVSKAAWLCKLTAAALLWSQLAGCALVGWGDGRMAVVAFYSRYVEALQPEQVVKVMDRAGFSTAEVEALGVDLRNALAVSGGARVLKGRHTVAIFLVHNHNVHVVSSRGGSFIFSPLTNEIR